MRWCEESITLYNAVYDPEYDKDNYLRTVINGVHWFCEIASTVEASGLRAANKYVIRIPTDADTSGKAYTDPISFAENPAEKFTLKSGDIIVRGIASEENPRPKDLHDKYADCVTVLAITDSTRAPNAPHWKVVGK